MFGGDIFIGGSVVGAVGTGVHALRAVKSFVIADNFFRDEETARGTLGRFLLAGDGVFPEVT